MNFTVQRYLIDCIPFISTYFRHFNKAYLTTRFVKLGTVSILEFVLFYSIINTAKIKERYVTDIHTLKNKPQVKKDKPFFNINPCYGCG